MDSVIRVSRFEKSYAKIKAVRGIDLEVRPGEIYGLIGPDGAGKSTLMKSIAGVLTYDLGSVEVFGTIVDSEKSAEKIKSRIGFMPQGLGLNLYPELSIEENIDFFARLRLVSEKDLKDRKDRMLVMTRLDRFRDRPMKNLSGGMKQKLGLICSLIHEPDLIILDEPTTGVDPVSRRDFWSILANLLWERGMTALVSTAYMEEAARFHRISLMHEGKMVASGVPEEITALAPGIMATVLAEPEIMALSILKENFGSVQTLGNYLKVFLKNETEESVDLKLRSVLNGVLIKEICTQEPELEDVFLQLINREQIKGNNPAQISIPEYNAPPVPEKKPETAIEANGLIRDFGEFRAVDDVSFSVPYGEIFGLLGANGAGKTTVIKMLTGILKPSSGEGHVAGADMRTAGQAIKERIGYMSQAFSLYTDLTVIENVRLYAGIYGLDKKAAKSRTDWVINMAELEGLEKMQTGSLPMGLRQRLALGCALVHKPQVLFLDEPTSGVDPLGRRRLWETFYRLSREEKVAILVTTHYMSEAEHCDHLALMFSGGIVADSSPEKMKKDLEEEAGSLIEVSSDNPLLALELLEKSGFKGVALFGKKIHFLTKDKEDAVQKLTSVLKSGGIKLMGVAPRNLSMEDVFVYRVLSLEKITGKDTSAL
ncbi:ATP-binding cassette domain-containing protein [Desulforegula conservatrix]|uniref:ATP-binding cassette domain-containing protein n=1 Tax=Desulforegula conservatrix TaxID=153026 RepID=UPI0004239D21|nr:ATP-binding cassette domain-containing protein [Desulforegula conservatrix]